MELSQQRATSFNPKAVPFSPTFATPTVERPRIAASTPMAAPRSVRGHSEVSCSEVFDPFVSDHEAEGERFRTGYSPPPIHVEDLFDRNIPLEMLVKTLKERPIDFVRQGVARMPNEHVLFKHTASRPVSNFPPFVFPQNHPVPIYNAVDIDELSAGLGLPTRRKKTTTIESSARSHKSRLAQGHPGELYGKLIGKALDKPLTANALADYLRAQNEISGGTTTASHTSENTVLGEPTSYREILKLVRPPPGFDAFVQPRVIPVEERAPVTPTPIHMENVPQGLYSFGHRPRNDSGQHFQHHSRRSSGRRNRPRHWRVKRTDQGPMPSDADIYPDDANWVPTKPIHQGFSLFSEIAQPDFQTANWPTPAEMYKPASPTPFEMLLESFSPPTATDVCAADGDVLTLIDQLPAPSIDTLLTLGISEEDVFSPGRDLQCDTRPLTPGQVDGSRYGVKFHGIGYGDIWICPDAEMGEPFRVRPRGHEGWGGWDWAITRGWASRP
ncbi:hypothetical protein P153DRAFT_433471 [Dothidotthia symphoricarpi CBS 119687]|uniref:Uncharacterized protein n=1 Tax=Dothidotthia symphoricarpi CBS 119687 TaxID=1392245 RepID=A0A6A6A533_9PLEO|nr:uncharacterized protein P153DRAFT_433471 [Dothidotthia symphoricarpi CBS 119687]KAF2126999.1 hypothetical protein P153DRAFT_433471 [Dothidotthia symphoricarpi CBS 119687]